MVIRFGEAGVFAKTYIPSKLGETFSAWKQHLLDSNRQIMHQRLANPLEHSSQFPELTDLLKCGEVVNEWISQLSLPAFAFSVLQGESSLTQDQLKTIDFFSIYSSEGPDVLKEKLTQISEQVEAVPPPDFSQQKSDESDEEEEEDTWGDEVEL